MSTDFKAPVEQSAAALLSGIVGDLQHLLQQQITLIRQEIGIELRHHATTGIIIGIGAGTLLSGGVTICLSLSHLLYWVMSPAGTEAGRLPLWACFAAVACLFLIAGGIMVRLGVSRFRSTESPDTTAATILEEHEEWKNQPR